MPIKFQVSYWGQDNLYLGVHTVSPYHIPDSVAVTVYQGDIVAVP